MVAYFRRLGLPRTFCGGSVRPVARRTVLHKRSLISKCRLALHCGPWPPIGAAAASANDDLQTAS